MTKPWADRPRAVTLGADKGYDAADFIEELRTLNVRPHVAQNTSRRGAAIDGRTTRQSGDGMSQRIRKRIEEAFGWVKTVAGLRKTKLRGLPRRLTGHSPSRLPPTTWCAFQSSWLERCREAPARHGQGLQGSLAHQRDGCVG